MSATPPNESSTCAADVREARREVRDVTLQIMDLIEGRSWQIQGAILAKLAGAFFSNFSPTCRTKAISGWVHAVRHLINANEQHHGRFDA